jgi:hypothetical protein
MEDLLMKLSSSTKLKREIVDQTKRKEESHKEEKSRKRKETT